PFFNYILTNSGNITVTQGGAGTNTITATLTSGPDQSVSFSAAGLPSGATAEFSPGSCILTCTSQLTISTTGSTPVGTFPITVTGSPLSKTTAFSFTVIPVTAVTVTEMSGTVQVLVQGKPVPIQPG